MARLTGTAGVVTFVARGVMGVTSWSVDYTGSTGETTGMDSAGVKSFLPTTTEWSGSVEGHYETTGGDQPPDPSETIGAPVAIDLETVAAGLGCAGNAICTGCSYTVSYDGTLDYNATFQGTGALTIA